MITVWNNASTELTDLRSYIKTPHNTTVILPHMETYPYQMRLLKAKERRTEKKLTFGNERYMEMLSGKHRNPFREPCIYW